MGFFMYGVKKMSKDKLDINDLRQKRAEIEAKAKALVEDSESLNDASQTAEFDALTTQFDELTAMIERMEKAEQMTATMAKKVIAEPAKAAQASVVHQPEVKGAKIARMVMAIGQTGGKDGRAAAAYAMDNFGDAEVAAALDTGVAASGGTLVPKAFMADYIELLRPQSVVRNRVNNVLPLPNGNLSIPKITGGSMSYYVGENQDATISEPTTGDLELKAKKLITMVPTSNEMLAYSGVSGGVESLIINDMTAGNGARQDVAFIRGDGANDTPTGLTHLASSANSIVAVDSAAPSVQEVATDLGKLELGLRNANVKMVNCGWLLSPITYMYLSKMRDGSGNKVYPEMSQGMLGMYPYDVTNNIPSNLGGGTETEIVFVDYNDIVIGDSLDLTISVSEEATYKDAGGNLVSAFSRDQTLIRLVTAHDIGARHDGAISVLTGVKWGT